MTAVHVVVPDGIDDPTRPSGGNTYDRHICSGLAEIGWTVYQRAVSGTWPEPDATARATLAGVIREAPDGATMLLDGLIASSVPDVLVPEAERVRQVVLVHMPLGVGPGREVADTQHRERAVLAAAAAVVTTSNWTRHRLLELYGLSPDHVHVAEPGVDAAELAPGTTAGGELLCVAAVTPKKGHDVLVSALALVADLPWHCVIVGALHREPGFVAHLGRQVREVGIRDRVRFTGPLAGADLDVAYAAADVLVLASRAETYGMVVSEALARGLPIVATCVGGLPEALGHGANGNRPGLLVPPGDSTAFAAALRCWLLDADVRKRLRLAAYERRETLTGWLPTSARIAGVLSEVTV